MTEFVPSSNGKMHLVASREGPEVTTQCGVTLTWPGEGQDTESESYVKPGFSDRCGNCSWYAEPLRGDA